MEDSNITGRPSSFREEFVEQAEKLAKLGATDMEIADFFGVSVRTIHRWKADHEDFCHSLKAGKEIADERVERSLFQRATGYEQESVKIFCGKNGDVTQVPFREAIAPDTTACIFWLKNRKKDEWRDTSKLELGGSLELKNLSDKEIDGKLARLLTVTIPCGQA